MTITKIKVPATLFLVALFLFGHLGILSKFASTATKSNKAQAELFSEDTCNQSFGKIYFDLGALAERRGDLCYAASCYQNAITHKENFMHAYDALGRVLELQGRHSDALKIYFKALSFDPEFEKIRFSTPLPTNKTLLRPRFEQGGLSLTKDCDIKDKTVFVVADKGLGETIQFCRFLSCLAEKGAQVIFRPHIDLVHLLDSNALKCKIIAPEAPSKVPPHDFYVFLSELPHVLDVPIDAINNNNVYLQPNSETMASFYKEHFSTNKKKVGLFLLSNRHNFFTSNSNSTQSFLKNIETLRNIQFFSLQKDHALINFPSFLQIIDLGINNTKINLAAMLANLDLIITIDSDIAHLAGAQGKPVWILLPKITDWQWLGFSKFDTTYWYPNMRKFQQREAENWQEVFDRIVEELRKT